MYQANWATLAKAVSGERKELETGASGSGEAAAQQS